eukprot:scaffold79282_cov29-Tisochrysis_lutea.AAC.8
MDWDMVPYTKGRVHSALAAKLVAACTALQLLRRALEPETRFQLGPAAHGGAHANFVRLVVAARPCSANAPTLSEFLLCRSHLS